MRSRKSTLNNQNAFSLLTPRKTLVPVGVSVYVVCFCAVVCAESLRGVPRDLASAYVLYQEAPLSYKCLCKVSAEAPQDCGARIKNIP